MRCGLFAELSVRGLGKPCNGSGSLAQGTSYRLQRFLQGKHPTRKDALLESRARFLPKLGGATASSRGVGSANFPASPVATRPAAPVDHGIGAKMRRVDAAAAGGAGEEFVRPPPLVDDGPGVVRRRVDSGPVGDATAVDATPEFVEEDAEVALCFAADGAAAGAGDAFDLPPEMDPVLARFGTAIWDHGENFDDIMMPC